MTPQEMADKLDEISVRLSMLTTDPREWGRGDVDASVEVWHRLDRLITDLSILRRDHGIVLGHRIPDEFTALTRDGTITVHRQTETSHQWDGDGVITDLSTPMIDTETGELTAAIPADVLRKVLPACGPGATSSKWNVTALRQVVPKSEGTRHKVVYGETLIGRGGLRAKNRKPRKPAPTESSQPVEDVVPHPVDSAHTGDADLDNVVYEDHGDDR
jgi:hypothetical protein